MFELLKCDQILLSAIQPFSLFLYILFYNWPEFLNYAKMPLFMLRSRFSRKIAEYVRAEIKPTT
jgi:hypothetical protein